MKLYYQPSSFRYGVVGDLGTLVVFLLVLATYRSNQGPRLETKIICCGIGCLLFILTVNWLVTRTNDEAIMLGTSEHGYALNLVDTNFKWRETDLRMAVSCLRVGSELRFCQLQLTVTVITHYISVILFTLRISELPKWTCTDFRPVGADDGATVAVCEVFAAPNSGVEKVALYRNGRWQLTVRLDLQKIHHVLRASRQNNNVSNTTLAMAGREHQLYSCPHKQRHRHWGGR